MTQEQYQRSIDELNALKQSTTSNVVENYSLELTPEEQALFDSLPTEVTEVIDEVLSSYSASPEYDFRRVLIQRGMVEVAKRTDAAVQAANIGFNARAK